MNSISCLICLDLLKDPVTIPCGHSYCMSCINGFLDQDDDKGIYSCPQCRQTFIPRPVLKWNTILAELVENLKKTKLPATPPDHYYAGSRDVECDFCIGRKLRAVKSCLVCLASYCETHLQPHNAFKKHKLVQASTQLEEKICFHHDKLLEVYCHTDQQCICLLCIIDEHKGHDTVSAAAERTENQKLLVMKHQKSQKRIQEREKEIQQLRQAVDSLKHSAKEAVEDSERIFTELICYIEKIRSELKELIRAQEKAEVSRAEGLLEQLEKEVAELRRRDVELMQLSHTEDHIHFIQCFQSLCASLVSEVLPSITVYPNICFQSVKKSVSELKDQLQDRCKNEMDKISRDMMIKIMCTVTSPGMAQPGPHPGARPGVGARMRAPGGRAFPHGARPGSARTGDVGPPSRGLTTHRRDHKGPVRRGSGGSRRQGPRQPDLWTRKLALGTWNVTSLAGKEPELVREVERFR
uniref:Uncharacterized protein n=1 Tax=Esox lucius TaxID=8010 RepID=A0A3P8XND8_ESOLU